MQACEFWNCLFAHTTCGQRVLFHRSLYWILKGSNKKGHSKLDTDARTSWFKLMGEEFAVKKVARGVKGAQVLSLSTCLSQCHCGPNMCRSIWTSVSAGVASGLQTLIVGDFFLQIPTLNHLKYSEVAYFNALTKNGREKE